MSFNRRVENLIADLRKVPVDYSGSRLSETLSIDKALESVLERYRINQPRLEEIIMKHWEYIMGERRSHRCAPQRIVRGNQLIIMVSNTTLKQEIEFEKRQVLKRIRQIPECSSINQIRIVNGN